jgi:hypothetical protein
MREHITTALDVLGLLLVAAGLAFYLWPYLGGAALAVSGALILIGSALAVPVVRRRHAGDEAAR